MGSFPSNLFFPDNPNRRARAEQLSDDCQNNQNDYKNAREALTQVLEPLHGKLDQVMKALGCQTLEEFDQKVLSTATGDALAEWEKVRTQYDTADMIECVIWTAAGIVALAGLAISTAMGIFSFGIGFVAGMAVTGIIDMVLATVGIIYDIIDGAIQRDKLRDAINQLFETRLKMKRTVYQAQAMMLIVPALNDWFDALIESGTVDQAKILASFERHKDHFTSNESQWTFYKTAQTLREMDQLRNSWMNEDPSWENLANNLDAAEASANTATALMSSRSRTAPSVYLGTKSVTPTHSPQIPLFANVHSGEQSLFMPAERALVPPPAVQEYVVTTDSPTEIQDSTVSVKITPVKAPRDSTADIFRTVVSMRLAKAIAEDRALVFITSDGSQAQFIAVSLSAENTTKPDSTSKATVMFFSVTMPNLCLQPDGSFASDQTNGQFNIVYA